MESARRRIRSDIEWLVARNPNLGRADAAVPLIGPGFATLVRLIQSQQVSLEAAAGMRRTLISSLGEVTPESLVSADDSTLRSAGFTSSKMRSVRLLAEAALTGKLDLDEIRQADDHKAVALLLRHHGIGPWTAQCYLLFGEGRRDVFPEGDLALREAWADYSGDPRPEADALADIAQRWAPRRSAAAFVLWSSYLRSRGRSWPD